MAEPTPFRSLARQGITSRVIRPGDPLPVDDDWRQATVAERIEAVWDLTLLAHAWSSTEASEPRLQRSVVRIQRPGR